jgi:hypothetical protein
MTSSSSEWISEEGSGLLGIRKIEGNGELGGLYDGPGDGLEAASSSAAFLAAAACMVCSAAALCDARTGASTLLGSVNLAVAIIERLGRDPDALLAFQFSPASAKM